MKTTIDGRMRAAIVHLRLLRNDPANAAYFVGLAYMYGLTVPQIATASGMGVVEVRTLLLGGAR